MDSTDYRVSTLLTEHLGFAPLTLIDEVINAVNHIMYKCADALEEFLKKRRLAQLEDLRRSLGDDEVLMTEGTEEQSGVFSLSEIRKGTAELETLLVSYVDKNFDKFELYTLRNILTLPKDLVEEGWILLKHHEDLDLTAGTDSSELDPQVKPLIDNINLELKLRKLLKLQLAKAKKIVQLLNHYKHCLDITILSHSQSKLLPEAVEKLRESLEPMNENVYYLLGQVDELLQQVLKLNDKFMKDKSVDAVGSLLFSPTNRDTYIREKSLRILSEIGVLQSSSAYNSSSVLFTAYAQTGGNGN